MVIRPEELHAKYVMLDELPHAAILPFVQKYLKKRTPSTVIYYVINILLLIGIAYSFITTRLPFDTALTTFGFGIFCSIALIPIHELIHGAAYKIQGAKYIKYKATLRNFVFYAAADKFVANEKQFRVVALAPIVVINLSLTLALIFTRGDLQFLLLGLLLVHTGACSGDFGLMSYYDVHKDKHVLTYDDLENNTSYFFTLSDNTKRLRNDPV